MDHFHHCIVIEQHIQYKTNLKFLCTSSAEEDDYFNEDEDINSRDLSDNVESPDEDSSVERCELEPEVKSEVLPSVDIHLPALPPVDVVNEQVSNEGVDNAPGRPSNSVVSEPTIASTTSA